MHNFAHPYHRILVIDDNRAIHEDFKKILAWSNPGASLDEQEMKLFGEKRPRVMLPEFRIDSAFQGDEGLSLIEKSLVEGRPYAMAFVDVRMPPGWDGVETIARIWQKYPDLQIVLCTAYSDYSWEDILHRLGYSDQLVILKKPFDNIEVIQLAVSLSEKWRLYHLAQLRLENQERMARDRIERLNKTNHDLAVANDMLQIATNKAQQMAKTAFLSAKAKSEFLANMSHEIRTPMNGVVGMVNLLLETPLSAEQIELARTIKYSADSLLNVINDILDFSKIEAGKMSLEKMDFDLGDMVRKTVELFEQRAKHKHLALDYSFSTDVPSGLIGDPMRLGQVLLNLLGNAIKFTEKGGVHLEISREFATEKKVVLRFAVRDTGIGISGAVQKNLFQSFTQGDASTTRKYGGTGLGLAICHQLVELMGGSLAVASAPGEGSTFWFALPFATPEPRNESDGVLATPVAPASEMPGWKLTSLPILLVEDDEINQFVGVKQLKKLGYTVEVAKNGAEAVDYWQQNRYQILLMDCEMPVMDGFAASRRIRAIEAQNHWPHTQIVAMTAHAMSGDRDRCLAAGMDGYVSKPVNNVDLKAVLEKAMGTVNTSAGTNGA